MRLILLYYLILYYYSSTDSKRDGITFTVYRKLIAIKLFTKPLLQTVIQLQLTLEKESKNV